ncbi:MAG: hypothetical protein EKK65_00360, partial [Lysobacterales bacterium]
MTTLPRCARCSTGWRGVSGCRHRRGARPPMRCCAATSAYRTAACAAAASSCAIPAIATAMSICLNNRLHRRFPFDRMDRPARAPGDPSPFTPRGKPSMPLPALLRRVSGPLSCCWMLFVCCLGVLPARAADEPRLSARSAILLDAGTGEILYERDPHAALPPASTTKVLTALIALERLDPAARLPV